MRFDLDCEVRPGEPLSLAIEDIDEDPEQPRREFDADALQELAETIKAGGVRQPISVRVHPSDPERWMLNFGARRLRASKLAGKADIPAFVDKAAGGYDQVIENEQREGLRPLELALFVQKRIAEGESQADIARRLGKSKMYVTYATALIDPPDWLMTLYRQGRCKGARELHELRRLHESNPERARALQAETGSFTRERVAALKVALLASPASTGEDTQASSEAPAANPSASRHSVPAAPTSTRLKSNVVTAAERLHKVRNSGPVLLADLEGSIVEVDTDSVPTDDGHVFVRTSKQGAKAVKAGRLRLLRIVAREDA